LKQLVVVLKGLFFFPFHQLAAIKKKAFLAKRSRLGSVERSKGCDFATLGSRQPKNMLLTTFVLQLYTTGHRDMTKAFKLSLRRKRFRNTVISLRTVLVCQRSHSLHCIILVILHTLKWCDSLSLTRCSGVCKHWNLLAETDLVCC